MFTEGTICDIRDKNFDWIVAITRGGLQPALQLATALDIHKIDTFCVSGYSDGGVTKYGKLRIAYKAYAHLQGRRVLLVDDLADTGRTFAFALDYLARQGATDVRTAALYVKNHSATMPDYYEKRIGNEWIVFPWEAEFEEVRTIHQGA